MILGHFALISGETLNNCIFVPERIHVSFCWMMKGRAELLMVLFAKALLLTMSSVFLNSIQHFKILKHYVIFWAAFSLTSLLLSWCSLRWMPQGRKKKKKKITSFLTSFFKLQFFYLCLSSFPCHCCPATLFSPKTYDCWKHCLFYNAALCLTSLGLLPFPKLTK